MAVGREAAISDPTGRLVRLEGATRCATGGPPKNPEFHRPTRRPPRRGFQGAAPRGGGIRARPRRDGRRTLGLERFPGAGIVDVTRWSCDRATPGGSTYTLMQ